MCVGVNFIFTLALPEVWPYFLSPPVKRKRTATMDRADGAANKLISLNTINILDSRGRL